MTILEQLHQDHVNLNRLLDILSHKVSRLRAGEHPNFGLLGDVIEYITNYADVHHHPREDKIYAYFHQRGPELEEAILRCEKEHHDMKHFGVELAEAVDCILHDAVMPMDKFADKLDSFVTHQKCHLDLEEGVLFPLLRQLATEEDWAALTEELPRVNDPLFGALAEQYSTLYQELLTDNAA